MKTYPYTHLVSEAKQHCTQARRAGDTQEECAFLYRYAKLTESVGLSLAKFGKLLTIISWV